MKTAIFLLTVIIKLKTFFSYGGPISRLRDKTNKHVSIDRMGKYSYQSDPVVPFVPQDTVPFLRVNTFP